MSRFLGGNQPGEQRAVATAMLTLLRGAVFAVLLAASLAPPPRASEPVPPAPTASEAPSSPRTGPTPDADLPFALLGEGVVGERIAAEPISDPAELFGLRAGEWTYLMTAGPRAGETRTEIMTGEPERYGEAMWHRAVGDHLVEQYTVSDTSDIVMTSWHDRRNGVTFEIEREVLLSRLKPGENRTSRGSLVAHKTTPFGRGKHRGRFDATIVYAGAYRITTPAGEFDAVLLETDYRIQIGPAKLRDTRYSFYVPGIGKVAEIERLRVCVLLLYSIRSKSAKVLIDYPGRPGRAASSDRRPSRTTAVRQRTSRGSTPVARRTSQTPR